MVKTVILMLQKSYYHAWNPHKNLHWISYKNKNLKKIVRTHFWWNYPRGFWLDLWFPKGQLISIRSNEFFFSNFYFYSSFNAEFCEDFRHGNNSSVTLKSPSLPKFKYLTITRSNLKPNYFKKQRFFVINFTYPR